MVLSGQALGLQVTCLSYIVTLHENYSKITDIFKYLLAFNVMVNDEEIYIIEYC